MKHYALAAILLTGTTAAHAATVIDLNNPANASRTTWSVAPGTDVTVIGSTTARDRQISIQNARNVEVRGGVWKPTVREYDGTIHTKNITGSVTITGATIDNSAVRGADGVIVNANGQTKIPFLMTNSTITGIRGKQGGDHADGVQPQGEVSTFSMENVKIDTDYQGLMLADQPNVAYGGKVDSISLTNVAINKLAGGESGCRYPIITGGNQSVSLSNVSVYSQEGCRGNGLLNVDNQARIKGEVSYGGDQGSVTGADAGAGGIVGTVTTENGGGMSRLQPIESRPIDWNNEEKTQAEYNIEGVGRNLTDTDEDIARAYDYSTARSEYRLGRLFSGEGFSNTINGVVNDGTNAVTGVVDDVVQDATDYVMEPIDDAIDAVGQTISCNFVGAALAGAASAINAVLTAGEATYGAQVAQYLTATSSNLCQGKQLATAKLQLTTQRRQLDMQKRMNARGPTNNAEDLNGMMGRSLPGMAAGGFLMEEGDILSEYNQSYPLRFSALTPQQSVLVNEQFARQERQAQMLSLQSQNRVLLEQAAGVQRARDYAAQGRAGLGLRSELMAANAIAGEQVAAINSLTFATVANSRAMTETKLREEAKKASSNASAEAFMSTLNVCADCSISRPFLGN